LSLNIVVVVVVVVWGGGGGGDSILTLFDPSLRHRRNSIFLLLDKHGHVLGLGQRLGGVKPGVLALLFRGGAGAGAGAGQSWLNRLGLKQHDRGQLLANG